MLSGAKPRSGAEGSVAAEGRTEKITCEDCIHAGVIIDDTYWDEEWGLVERLLKKYCPSEYLFNHPNPEKCPNFAKREAGG